MRILVTGGLGYIGSHCVPVLAAAGHQVSILDYLGGADADAGRRNVHERLRRLAGLPLTLFLADIRDRQATFSALEAAEPELVVHFAGLKSAMQSLRDPPAFHRTNVDGTRHLLEAMTATGCKRLVFSSSAAVYGFPVTIPVSETHRVDPLTPYAQTKLDCEAIIAGWVAGDTSSGAVALRYFNPGGCHDSGLIGEFSDARTDNLIPVIARVATGLDKEVVIFGDSYDTPDGTAIRDFIHIMDLAEAHAAAVEFIAGARGFHVVNVGAGEGRTVLEAVRSFETALGSPVPHRMAARRPGDISVSIACTKMALEVLGWRAQRGLAEICRSALAWQQTQNRGS